ncbi:hypothetical protein P154DRAFT_575434 [Amniculicola lignicola CBS 123094]|uniref:Uncharacterized protein n=1 Tax=Amniculicola lignicola CBS 123094 TaxID=1392246 RepID=A0A6A5WJD5_9PLEO|nr:hypothetical protein P154DRAFT_575434 [Amniculicola lignicola CBS 123094]
MKLSLIITTIASTVLVLAATPHQNRGLEDIGCSREPMGNLLLSCHNSDQCEACETPGDMDCPPDQESFCDIIPCCVGDLCNEGCCGDECCDANDCDEDCCIDTFRTKKGFKDEDLENRGLRLVEIYASEKF